VASRTNKDRTTIEVPHGVREQLKVYQTALHRDLNRRASNGEIIGALLSGVPLWQADAMLGAYKPQGKSIDIQGEDDGG
jgi:hypothetical protein